MYDRTNYITKKGKIRLTKQINKDNIIISLWFVFQYVSKVPNEYKSCYLFSKKNIS